MLPLPVGTIGSYMVVSASRGNSTPHRTRAAWFKTRTTLQATDANPSLPDKACPGARAAFLFFDGNCLGDATGGMSGGR